MHRGLLRQHRPSLPPWCAIAACVWIAGCNKARSRSDACGSLSDYEQANATAMSCFAQVCADFPQTYEGEEACGLFAENCGDDRPLVNQACLDGCKVTLAVKDKMSDKARNELQSNCARGQAPKSQTPKSQTPK